jgi:regulator of protease activity HflC (stomatin/prohibitin superfamily)
MPENRTYQKHGLEFQVEWKNDDDSADLSYLDCVDDAARLAAWNRNDWVMLQCGVTARIRTETMWAVPNTVGRAYLSQIESDSDAAYLSDVEESLEAEALADARMTMAALQRALAPAAVEPLDLRQMALVIEAWVEVEA